MRKMLAAIAIASVMVIAGCKSGTRERWTSGPSTHKTLLYDFRPPRGTTAARATGAFTENGRSQEAAIVNGRLRIVEGQAMLGDIPVPADRILAVMPLSADGRMQLLLAGTEERTGMRSETALLAGFVGKELRILEHYGTVREDSCRSALAERGITAVMLYSLPGDPGAMSRVAAEVYRAPCEAPERWVKVEPR